MELKGRKYQKRRLKDQQEDQKFCSYSAFKLTVAVRPNKT